MRAVVGLGNPGPEYAATRHNAGFVLADALRRRWQFPAFTFRHHALVTEGRVVGQAVTLLKPQTYMNDSGSALGPVLRDPDLDPARDLLILVDEAALPLGTFRLRARGSSGGHNGLESVEEAVGSQAYCRLRIGVGPPPAEIDDLADFVLAGFTRAETAVLNDLLPTLCEAVECWVAEGIEPAMNRFNRRPDGETDR